MHVPVPHLVASQAIEVCLHKAAVISSCFVSVITGGQVPGIFQVPYVGIFGLGISIICQIVSLIYLTLSILRLLSTKAK